MSFWLMRPHPIYAESRQHQIIYFLGGKEKMEPKKRPKWALLIIDMENAFVDPSSPHCIKMARESLPACKSVVETCREVKMPIFYIKRTYRADGSDVEITRWDRWANTGRSMAPGSTGAQGADYCTEIKPQQGDYLMYKPRWSAFFQTSLDLLLRRLGVQGVVIIGTTTPNCIRTTAYDANAYDYETVIISDATSSQTPEIQKANLVDMKGMGARILSAAEFAQQAYSFELENWVEQIRRDKYENELNPELINLHPDGTTGWIDKW
jgi:nicotinamidase-related amidase